MPLQYLRLSLVVAVPGLAGCAAMITGSGTSESETIRAGATESQLLQRLGPRLQSQAVSHAQRAWDLREEDPRVSLLVYPAHGFDASRGSYPIPPPDMAVTMSTFRFVGRVGRDSRASQPGFDSFMTLGLAEVFLVPKALVERAGEGESHLTVWFDARARAVAYKWSVLNGEPSRTTQ